MVIAGRIVAGTGALMACAFITLISMTGTQWVKDHPTGTMWLGVALLVGSIFCFMFWLATSEKRQAVPNSNNSGNFAGRDNLGAQISGSIVGNDALEKILKVASHGKTTQSKLYIQSAEYVSIDDPARRVIVTECLRQLVADDRLIFEVQNHNFVANGKNYVKEDPHPNHKKKLHVIYSFNGGPLREAIEREESILSIPQPFSVPVPPLPVLDLDFGAPLVAVGDCLVDFVESRGFKCYSIHVHNRLAEAGAKASRADSISARITFKHEGSSPKTFVDRCCWIGKAENEIYLCPGDTAQVLCGIPKGTEWTTYENPNQTAPGDWGHYRSLNKVVIDLFPNARIIGDISVVTHSNNQSTTLVKREFVISVDSTGISVSPRWRDEI
jgi:hypothetical protein